MRDLYLTCLGTTLLLVLAGIAEGQCASGGLVVVVNKRNPTESLSVAQLRRLILGDVRTWPDRKPVTLINRDAGSTAFKCVLQSIVRMSDAEYRRYIVSAEFRGGEAMAIRNASSGAAAGRVVASSAGSIAVVEASDLPALAGTVRVMRVGGKEPGEAGYPL